MPSLWKMLAGMLPGIFLFMVSTACLANGVDARLNRDKTVTGAVTGTATDKYTFTVEAGKSFVLSLDKSEKQFDKDFMLAVKLFDPDKRLLAGGAQQLFRAPFINEAEGDWTIEIGRGIGALLAVLTRSNLWKCPVHQGCR